MSKDYVKLVKGVFKGTVRLACILVALFYVGVGWMGFTEFESPEGEYYLVFSASAMLLFLLGLAPDKLSEEIRFIEKGYYIVVFLSVIIPWLLLGLLVRLFGP